MEISNKLKILQEEKDGKNITIIVEPNFPMPNEMRIGIDPGTRNLGIAIIRPKIPSVTLYKIVLERHEKALLRLLDVQQVLGRTIGHFQLNAKAIIEGASYRSIGRHVELAEQRAAMMLWFHMEGIDVEIVPPATIRKSSFGHGRMKNPWEDTIDDNCAAALGAAFYNKKVEETND